MFWKKPKFQINNSSVQLDKLASRLGVERRFAIRIHYPRIHSGLLPSISFNGKSLKASDISTGGCCLLDNQGVLGPSVGNEASLTLGWPNDSLPVRCRIVSRVDNRRHIQFLDLPAAKIKTLAKAIHPGSLALNVRPGVKAVEHGPTVMAREIWTSPAGDCVTIEDHIHRLAQISLAGVHYTLYKQAIPIKETSAPLSHSEMACLVIFLRNIPQPSEHLQALLTHVESFLQPVSK